MNFDELRKARRDAKAHAYMLVSPFFLWFAWETADDLWLSLAFLTFGVLWGGLGAMVLYFKYREWRDGGT